MAAGWGVYSKLFPRFRASELRVQGFVCKACARAKDAKLFVFSLAVLWTA